MAPGGRGWHRIRENGREGRVEMIEDRRKFLFGGPMFLVVLMTLGQWLVALKGILFPAHWKQSVGLSARLAPNLMHILSRSETFLPELLF